MMDSSAGPNRLSCPEAALLLEKQLLEETLSEQERNALFHHLSRCPECREVDTVMTGLPRYKDVLTDNGLRAMVGTVKTAYYKERKKKRRFQTAAILAGTAAAAVLLILLSSLKLDLEPPSPTFAETCSPSKAATAAPGVQFTHCNDAPPRVAVAPNGDVTLSIQKGAVGVSVDPHRSPKAAVAVQTPFGEVRVKGTIFTVRVDTEDARVEVFRGTVEVVPASASGTVAAYDVSYGRGAYLKGYKLFDLATAGETNILRRPLNIASAQKEPVAIESPESSPVAPEDIDPPQAEDTESPSTVSARFPPPSLENLIREAHDCLLNRDWRCAASRYQRVLKHYPGQPESTAALISLAGIELRRLGQPKKALDHYKAYQRRAPNGTLAEEALFGTAEAYRRLGISDREAASLRRFVERYPDSLKAGEARKRLTQLKSAK